MGLWGERGCRFPVFGRHSLTCTTTGNHSTFFQPEMGISFSLIGKHLVQPEMRLFTSLTHPQGDIPSFSQGLGERREAAFS